MDCKLDFTWDTGDAVKQFMKNKIIYTNEALEAKVVKDFFPKPEELILKKRKLR